MSNEEKTVEEIESDYKDLMSEKIERMKADKIAESKATGYLN